jgi:hypothetical protein
MIAQRLQRRILPMDHDGFFDMIENTIQQEWNTGNMIQMGMGQKDMADLLHFSQGKITHPGAGINQDLVIKAQGGRPQVLTDSTAAS